MGVEELAVSIAEEKIQAALQRARSLESTDRHAAAAAYDEAAGLADKIAGMIKHGYARKQAQERGANYRLHANRLRNPAPARPRTQEPTNPRGDPRSDDAGGGAGPGDKHLAKAAQFATTADVTWDDIAGLDETKRLLKGMVFSAVAKPPPGVKVPPPSGILLYGPPGTGKTMLAAAAAGSFGATFLNIPASKLKDKYVGESAKILQAVFDHAENHAPALIFFDDIDTVVTNRDSGENSSVSRDLIGGLLTAMDGFKNKVARDRPLVLVFANTNQPWSLDEALMSRFTQRVHVPLPDFQTRVLILRKLIEEAGYRTEHTIEQLAAATERFSGRELDNFRKAIITEMVSDANREAMEQALSVAQMRQAALKVTTITCQQVDRVLGKMRPKTSEDTLKRMEAWGDE